MRKYIKRKIKSYGNGVQIDVDSHGNVFATKGTAESYPCVVCHMDEVCPEKGRQFEVLERDGKLFGFNWGDMERRGLGGDDKNGIWVALNCLQKLDVVKCAFFVGEEVGCVGSSSCDLSFFSDVNFIVEPDRRNGHDLITAGGCDWCTPEFLAAIEPYVSAHGYKQTNGLTTDVDELTSRNVGVCCLNISCGYYNPHTDHDYTIFSELENALGLTLDLCQNIGERFPNEYTPRSYSWNYGWSYPTYSRMTAGEYEKLYAELYKESMRDDFDIDKWVKKYAGKYDYYELWDIYADVCADINP
ncbi:MAG: hypothetical protein HUJ86_05505 [Synergistes sp.]|nr:hypothetical protein [Synergistes sp.]